MNPFDNIDNDYVRITVKVLIGLGCAAALTWFIVNWKTLWPLIVFSFYVIWAAPILVLSIFGLGYVLWDAIGFIIEMVEDRNQD